MRWPLSVQLSIYSKYTVPVLYESNTKNKKAPLLSLEPVLKNSLAIANLVLIYNENSTILLSSFVNCEAIQS